jgi:tetraacyldisaccharide 4'-kinase
VSRPEQIWSGRGPLALLGVALAPLGQAYSLAMRLRNGLYDAGWLASFAPDIPVVSIGNLTVGGTGKTPVAAWVAAQLRPRARPAVLLRGYGGDEAAVHARLNPSIPVVVAADRVAGVREAVRLGADVVVADDAFQHRRLRRTADIVLLSVEQLQRPRRVLPAGAWREAPGAARRADLIVFTRKSAPIEQAERAMRELGSRLNRPVASIHLLPGHMVNVIDGTTMALEKLRDRDVLAVAAVGEPDAFRAQLDAVGARVTLAAFRDHHRFTPGEAQTLASMVPRAGLAVCTLKDAVKLAQWWPGSSPLWYVSQQLVVEKGAEHLNRLLERVLEARAGTATTAG